MPEKRVAIVTGAAQGMGEVFAHRLANDGFYVVALDVKDSVSAVSKAINNNSDRSAYKILDLSSNFETIDKSIQDIAQEYGNLEVLINNAGLATGGPSEDVLEKDWILGRSVMLDSVFYASKSFANILLSKKSIGSIVNIGSITGMSGWSQRITYGVAKSGVIQLTRVLGVEWANKGIRVNAISPGQVETPINEEVFRKGLADRKTFTNRAPLKRFADPSEIAHFVSFLCSQDAAYITGQNFVVDGGWNAWGQM